MQSLRQRRLLQKANARQSKITWLEQKIKAIKKFMKHYL